ncbi:MAG: TatD family hydrolase [Bacteroidia bacterium]
MQYVNIHTHFSGNENHIEIINSLPQEENDSKLYYSCGIHPWFIQTNYENQLQQLRFKISHSNIIAVGECGLDKLKGPELSVQKNIFTKQIQLANEINLPIIIHNVKAYQEILKLLQDFKNNQPVIFHGFNNNLSIARQIIDKGYYLSFGAALFNPKLKASEVLKAIPYSQFFLETDDNKKYRIEDVYNRASEILNIPLQKLKEDLFLRFKAVFKKA